MKIKQYILILITALAFSSIAHAQRKVSERSEMTPGMLQPGIDLLPIVDTSAGATAAGSKYIYPNTLFDDWGFTAVGKSIAKAPSVATMKSIFSYGTAADLNHGTSAGNLVRLDPTTGKLPALDGSLLTGLPASNISAITGLGANVATALVKPTGALGAVQLVGDVQTPSAIQLPDMTGLTAPVGYIGFKNGQLAVADNVTPGGNLVTPSRRFVGSKKVNFSGQSFTRAFAKVMSIPMTAAEMQTGKDYQLIGEFSFYCGSSSPIDNVTKVLFGMSWLSGSVLSQGATNNRGPNLWNGTPIVPPTTSLTRTCTKYNFSQRISAQAPNVHIADWNSGGTLRDFNEFAISHYPGSNVITNNNISSFGPVPIAPTAVANEICLMLQFDRSDTGTYGALSNSGEVLTTWNLELVQIN